MNEELTAGATSLAGARAKRTAGATTPSTGIKAALPWAAEAPAGMRDRMPEEAARLRRLGNRLLDAFGARGYREIATPMLEYLDAVAQSGVRPEDCFQLLDPSGRTLVLRPDMTAGVARAAAHLAARESPMRLSYLGPVFRRGAGELWQAGVELIGAGGAAADAEALALVVEAFEEIGLTGFQVSVGHVGVVRGVLAAAGADGPSADALSQALAARDLVGFDRLAGPLTRTEQADLLPRMARWSGDLAAARETFGHLRHPGVVTGLEDLSVALGRLGVASARRIALDLGLVPRLDYYTGLVFEVYAPRVGAPVAGGGRYEVRATNGSTLPAVGFAADLDLLLTVLDVPGAVERASAGIH